MASGSEFGSLSMAVGSNNSPGRSQDGWSRFMRLTAAFYPQRFAAKKTPPFDLRATVDIIRGPKTSNAHEDLAAQDTRPSIGMAMQDGGVGVEHIFDVDKSPARMPIHQLLSWTRLDGHLELHREIPRGMALDLMLKGRKSKWRLVRGSTPRDEVLRGV